MRHDINRFQIDTMIPQAGYVDFTLYDKAPNAVLRQWIVSHDVERDLWEVNLFRSETEEAPLDIHCKVSSGLTKALIELCKQAIKAA